MFKGVSKVVIDAVLMVVAVFDVVVSGVGVFAIVMGFPEEMDSVFTAVAEVVGVAPRAPVLVVVS